LAGGHTIKVVYGGDSNFKSDSAQMSQTVNQAGPTVTLSSSLNPSTFGQNVTFKARVTNPSLTPTGSVSFYNGGALMGTAPLAGDSAELSTSALTGGNHTIKAVYGGDANFRADSTQLSQSVNKEPTSSVLTATPNPSTFGQSVTLRDSVHGSVPDGGKVYFTLDGVVRDSAAIDGNGVAAVSISGLGAGSHPASAFYGGTVNFDTSTSNALLAVVNKRSTTSTLTTSPNPSFVAQSVTFRDSVDGPPDGGKVYFSVDGVLVDSANVNGAGVATFTTSALTAGARSISAHYSGTANFDTSTSNQVAQVVNYLVITASAGANGTVSPAGAVNVNYGSSHAFTFSPGTGYHVDSAFVDGSYVDSLEGFTFNNVTASHTINVKFAINTYTITAVAAANGSISPSGAVSVNYGGSQAFTFAPSTGYHVDTVRVDGAVVDSLSGYTFANVTSNHTIAVKFAINTYTILAGAGSNGAINPSGAVSATYGSNKRFTFAPGTGYHVDTLLVDGIKVDSLAGYTFVNVTADHAINVKFAINSYTISATAGANGSINPTGTVTLNFGGTQRFTYSVITGYHVDTVRVDGIKIDSLAGYTFASVSANHTIDVTFAINTYTITATAGPHGSIAPSGGVTVTYGAGRAFTWTPVTGYHVDSVLVDGATVDSLTGYTFSNVTTDHSISVKFAINTFAITATAGTNGSINPSGNVVVAYGSNRRFTFAANTGYHPDSLFVDGARVDSLSGYTFMNVTGSHTIRVTFAINEYTITVGSVGKGTVSPTGTTTLPFGSSLSLNITPDLHYAVDSVVIDSVWMGKLPSVGFNNISADHTVMIYFGLQEPFTVRYRSFTYDSLIAKKATLKKPINDYWEFMIHNDTRDTVRKINIEFRNYIKEFVRSGRLVPSGARKNWSLTGKLAPGDSVLITGWSLLPKLQYIRKLWFGATLDRANQYPRYEHRDLPMPNAADVRNDVFKRGAFAATKGLIVGIPRPDAKRFFGWARMVRTNDMRFSLGSGKNVHTGTPRGFDKRWLVRPFVYEQRSVSPRKHNNRLFADLMALKFNIGMSALGVTHPGFGELRFTQTGHPFDKMLVREIAARADSAMTYLTVNPPYYAFLDSTISRINRAFCGTIDTIRWSDTLQLKGVTALIDVPFLIPSDVPAVIVQPSAANAAPDLPLTVELYQNFPNPFNPTTTIEFNLPVTATVTLKLYNILGQEVATLYDHELLDEGVQDVEFNGSNIATGVYFYRLVAETLTEEDQSDMPHGTFTITKKMMLIK
jgi:hypothetical protein